MQSIVGKVLSFEDLVQIPARNSFLDKAKGLECREIMTQQKDVEFLPIHVCESYLPERDGQLSVEKYAFRMYKIIMYGIVKSGEKVTVVLDGILPFFEIRVPRGEDTHKFLNKVVKLCTAQGFKLKDTAIVRGATIKEYGDKADFIHMKFWSIGERSKTLNYFDKEGYETTHDDATCYYRVVCRDTLTSWTSWVTLKNYRAVKNHRFFKTHMTLIVRPENVQGYRGDTFADPYLKNDRTIEALFDLETADPNVVGDVPQPESATAEMFKASLAFVGIDGELASSQTCDPTDEKYDWTLPKGHLIHYDITTRPTLPMKDRVVVICRNMSEMIMAFGLIWSRMQPDYSAGFNSDNYDWRWIAEKARQLNLLEFLERNMSLTDLSLYRIVEDKAFENPKTPFIVSQPQGARVWSSYPYWKKYQFKISAELNCPGACLNYPGYVNMDLMLQLRALCGNPEKYGLHYFLKLFELGDKVDMPYKEMFAMNARSKRIVELLGPLKDMRWETLRAAAVVKGLTEQLEKSALEMVRVAEYCIVDSLRCHDLLVKTQFIRDRREIGALSFTPMDDCVYRANGMKVRNMIIAKGQSRGLHISNRAPKKIEQGKYPGAFVFPPRKGIATAKPSPKEMRASRDPRFAAWRAMPMDVYERVLDKIAEKGVWFDEYTDVDFQNSSGGKQEWPACFIEWLAVDTHYPIAGLDFSSLYPSLIMTYNLSPEMMVHTLERAIQLASEGKKVHPINFKFNGRDIKGWSVRHKYQEQEKEINDIFKRLIGITDDDLEEQLLARLETILIDTEFGLFPSVLKTLFDQRKAMKGDLSKFAARKEHLENMPPEEFAKHQEEYRDVCFRWNSLNSKQKALKVFMNTFYGEAGNSLSPLRVLALAGGTTSSGQYNIKKVATLVVELTCRIYYGDTDSVYISMPRRAFNLLDRAYYSQRGTYAYFLLSSHKNDKGELHELWEWQPYDAVRDASRVIKPDSVGPLSKAGYYESLVMESFRQIKTVNKAVNDALEADNGTKFLVMAFEEFLFPAAFFSKKKYCGIAHEGSFNAYPKKIFVRGLEYVKKGVSQMLKDISLDILWRTFDRDNLDSIFTIVERKIEEIYTARNIEFEKFVKTASYKPNKQNVSVHTFHRRMLAIGMPPEPLDRFRYVMVKKYPFKYDIKGRKSELSVGDRMEYADRAKTLGLEIDLDYYMSSGVCGQLARFISYHDDFHVDPRDDSDEAYAEAELKIIASAKKFILSQYEKYSEKHVSKGPALKTLYKKVNTAFHDEFSNIMKVSDLWQFDQSTVKVTKPKLGQPEKNPSQHGMEENQNMYDLLLERIERQAVTESKRESTRTISGMRIKTTEDWIAKRNVYKTLVGERKAIFQRTVPHLRAKLRAKTNMLKALFEKRDQILEANIQQWNARIGIERENFESLDLIIGKIERLNEEELLLGIAQSIKTNIVYDDLLLLGEIDTLYLKLLSVAKLVNTTQMVFDELTSYVHYKLSDVSLIHETDHLRDLNEFIEDNIVNGFD